MDVGIISARYARALWAFAKERKTETPVYLDMRMLADSFESEPALKEALANPVIPFEKKRTLVVSAAGIEVSGAFERFVALVLQRKRENLLQLMCLSYLSLYRREKHIHRLHLYSAVPLAPETRDRLLDKMKRDKGGTMEVSEHVCPGLIGGMVIRMDHYRFDASVAAQLKRVGKELAAANR